MTNRLDDINELLCYNDKKIENINSIYLTAFDNYSIIISKVEVKNILENYRSILDFCIHDIDDIIYNGLIKDIYFPYGKDMSLFTKSLNKNKLNDLVRINKNVYSLLLNIQSFQSSNQWLYNLCKLTNINKHDKLTRPLKKVNKLSYKLGDRINIQNCGKVIFKDSYYNGRTIGKDENNYVEIGPETTPDELRAQTNNEIPVTITSGKVEFNIQLNEQTIEIKKLLNEISLGIKSFINLLYTELGVI
ncbi:hypothetical protein [Treponema primitia]|nr:hypothetical protein [Treponema primitia]